MEVATTNNHHHHHHLGHQLHHPTATTHRLPMAKQQQQQQQPQSKLSLTVNSTSAVDPPSASSITSPRSPFQREVREWQRVDPDTGALLSGRLEADRWINGPLNKYGKKSNSGGSNNSNSSNNSTTTMNTHTHNPSAATAKVSLHSIVGGGGGGVDKPPKNAATTNTTTHGATVPGTKTWQQQQERQHNARHLEQATLYGQNSNSSRARVGVLADCCDVADVDDDDDVCVVTTATTSTAGADETRLHNQHKHKGAQTKNELSDALTPTRRRDLESFRHYASSKAKAALEAETAERAMLTGEELATDDSNASKHDDLRLSTRQLRRQQQPFGQSSSSSSSSILQRSHSISTDDLSNDWEGAEGVAESNEWRRVSKLRRSFQSSTPANNNNNSNSDKPVESSFTAARRRPLDLPASSVSVSRIRAELESGRRLTTAMRNNHVDLAALDTILHGSKEVGKTTSNAQKTNALLTAESLKEIRGRLKKLSDESLYKDDFIAHQQPPSADEHIEVQQSVRRKLSTPRLQQLTPDQSLEITTPAQKQQSYYEFERAHRKSPERNISTSRASTATHSPSPKPHTSHSLETRQKVKDTNSQEWHSRRKSYGFEKMSPPDAKSMSRMDASTDSGLGRSSELGNWSPTEATPSTRATVIHFGETAKVEKQPQTPFRARLKSPARRTPSDEEDLHKRHSIAVDESQYVRDNLRKTSQVHLNGFQERFESAGDGNSNSTLFLRSQNAQKRVEFCKTEVHFAAESGRVNIVETDGKPPPTNNFRRRRRTTSGALQSLTRTATSAAVASMNAEAAGTAATTSNNVTLFGGSDDIHQNRHRTIASSVVAYKAMLVDPPDTVSDANALATSVTVSVQNRSDSKADTKRASYASTSGIDTTDNENDEIAAIRGILKNKPVKPKPYHLGENIESADALWGVQLKPVSGSGITVSSHEKDDSPTVPLNKSVAERVRIVEKRHEHSGQNGYSTKINLSLDEPTTALRVWPDADLPKSNIMSIELHSPQISLEKRDSFKRNNHTAPVAKPRNIASALNSTEHHKALHSTEHLNASTAAQREALKIVKEARGARKLREHELSYFGVPHTQTQHDSNEPKTNRLPNTSTISTTKRTLPSRQHQQRLTIIGNEDATKLNMMTRRHDENTTNIAEETTNTNETKTATKWQLLNDKPDLLRHSPMVVEPQMIQRTAEVEPARERARSAERRKHLPSLRLADDDDGGESDHYYENIANEKITPVFKVKSPQPYDRKTDMERDAYILSEMNENADLTMKALSDEAAHKDRRRRRRSSLNRRESTPLETIDEKMVTHKPIDTCIAVKMSRGTLASEAKRHTRTATSSPHTHDIHARVRTSSQSSVESCPRARSRSLSSEREYENIRASKSTRTRTASPTKTPHVRISSSGSAKQQQRSSSRDSQRSARLQYSSGDEVSAREEQRVRLKSKRCANATSASNPSRSVERRSKKESAVEHEKPHSMTSRDEERRRAASSTTHASQREERAECTAGTQQQQRTTSSGRSSKRREETAGNTGSGSGSRHASSRGTTQKSRSGNGSGIRLFRSLRRRADDAHACAVHHNAERRTASEHRPTSEREKVGTSEREHEKVERVRESARERECVRERAHEKENSRESKSKSRGHSAMTTSKHQHQHSNSEHQRLGSTGAHQHKKSSTSATHKQHEPAATETTHSKSSKNMNGRHTGAHHDGHHKHSKNAHTTKEHRKRSEHSTRERK